MTRDWSALRSYFAVRDPDAPREPQQGVGRFVQSLAAIPRLLLIVLVRIYQWTLSPIIGRQCRFDPTCSNYFIGAVRKYGAIRGAWRGLLRICRCHPFHPGGVDPP
jgi:putative membrane protein insertion efficiency factor